MATSEGVSSERIVWLTTRSGRRVVFEPPVFLAYLNNLTAGLHVDADMVLAKLLPGLPRAVSVSDLGDLAVETAGYMALKHPDYCTLAGRIAQDQYVSSLRTTRFSEVVHALHTYVDPKLGTPTPLVSDEFVAIVTRHAAVLDAAVAATTIDLNVFAFKTLTKSYLLRMYDRCVETPAGMYMRTAVGIHLDDLDSVLATFRLLAQRYISHATPTLFNAGTLKSQLSSCFLVRMKDDSIEGIFDTLKSCAMISKYAGGVGLSVHNIRSTGSYIAGTNGTSNGLVPMLRVFSDTARYVDQGGGKRKGSFAIYLEPWHADIMAFLELKKNHGKEEDRARDLFYALWVPDLFMERVKADGTWSLFCPNEAKGLSECHGDAFRALYERYEAEGRARETIRAQDLWSVVLNTMIETGTPYVLFKDACNRYSNHTHLGTIKTSNLCTEIVQYTSEDETAVCNLGAVVLDTFVDPAARVFDFATLETVVAQLTRNLNRVIDVNYYPVEEARTSNLRHRPIGIGVVGLADAFAKMGMAFTSAEAAQLNKHIFETMYFAAMTASVDLAERHGPYESFAGSPLSRGQFQFDLMGVAVDDSRHDWTALRARVMLHGARNSLLMAIMPTASTAQIIGRQESIEAFFSMAYSRRVLAGDFPIVNSHLVHDLEALGLWTEDVRRQLVINRGSVQAIPAIPAELREKYRTVFEIPHRVVLQHAIDRQPFICQAQSLNAHVAEPTQSRLTSMLFFAWENCLKNGVYYLRTKPAENPIQMSHIMNAAGGEGFAISPTTTTAAAAATTTTVAAATPDDVEECLMCSA